MKYAPFEAARIPAAVTAAVAFALVGIAANAPAAAQNLPSYATGEESIRGRIVSVDGSRLQVRDERGYIDNVSLHNGTIINPTGLRLAAGQSVTVLGHNDGKDFAAHEIDTPYASYPGPGAVAYAYPYPAYAYGPYPVYGAYGYGYPYYRYPASVNLRFGFGYRDGGFGIRGRI